MGIRLAPSYITPLPKSLCSYSMSPWSAVQVTIVFSARPSCSRAASTRPMHRFDMVNTPRCRIGGDACIKLLFCHSFLFREMAIGDYAEPLSNGQPRRLLQPHGVRIGGPLGVDSQPFVDFPPALVGLQQRVDRRKLTADGRGNRLVERGKILGPAGNP
jgi:hypothetical protein